MSFASLFITILLLAVVTLLTLKDSTFCKRVHVKVGLASEISENPGTTPNPLGYPENHLYSESQDTVAYDAEPINSPILAE